MKIYSIPFLILFFAFEIVCLQAQDRVEGVSFFQLCGNGKTYPYYQPELQYDGEFGKIKRFFFENYHKPLNFFFVNNSGIVKVAFVVNCNGETGNYVIETCSFDYKPINFSWAIKNQLLQITQSLKNWIPAKNQNNEAVNSHKFFAFKIKNGNLIEILPK